MDLTKCKAFREGEKAGYHRFLFFPIIFLILLDTSVSVSATLDLSSANALTFSDSKRFTFERVCGRQF